MTFTLIDAINHEAEMADSGTGSSQRAQEHRQIAFWLTQLHSLLEGDKVCNRCTHFNSEYCKNCMRKFKDLFEEVS